MKRVAGYGRVSTMAQASRGTSAQEQSRRIEEECKKNGYNLVKVYKDDGFSGKTLENRPGLQNLIADAKMRRFDSVMFTRLDRLGRTLRDLLNIWRLFEEELMLDVICIDEPNINSKGLGKIMLHVMGAFAEFEREVIRERTESGRRKTWIDNSSVIGSYPYGYCIEEPSGKVVMNPTTANIVRKIYSLYLDQRLSIKDIANQLSGEGVPTPSAIKNSNRKSTLWNHVTVNDILKNSAYIGIATHNVFLWERRKGKQYMQPSKQKKDPHEWIQVKFPPIIKVELFENVQALMKEKTHRPKKKYKAYKDHFLLENNMLYCGECGGRMKKVLKPKSPLQKGFYFYYSCYWHSTTEKELKMHGRERCSMKINEEDIDNFVLNKISRFLGNPSEFCREWLKDVNHEDVKERTHRLTKKREEIEAGINRLLDETYKTTNAEVGRLIEEKIKRHTKEFEDISHQLKNACQELNLIENKRKMLREFEHIVEKLTCDGEQSVRPRFNFRMSVRRFIRSLSFDAKRKLLETVISPENGGKCIVKYKKHDSHASEDNKLVEINFKVDTDKIRRVIASLDRKELLNKFDESGTPLANVDGRNDQILGPFVLQI